MDGIYRVIYVTKNVDFILFCSVRDKNLSDLACDFECKATMDSRYKRIKRFSERGVRFGCWAKAQPTSKLECV
jgi:hypothetical protein